MNILPHLENMRGAQTRHTIGKNRVWEESNQMEPRNASAQIDCNFDRFGRVVGHAHRAGPVL
jgi:hypothetical protein